MKLLRFNTLVLLCFCFINLNANNIGKKEFIKKVQKVYTANDNVNVGINNSYGEVHIFGWDKSEVSIEVTIKVLANSESAADNMFNRITISFKGDKADIEAKTLIAKKNKKWWDDWIGSKRENLEYSINYKVYLPEEGNLNLINKHGDAFINGVEGNTDIDLKYGNLQLDDNERELSLILGHGKAFLRNVNSMTGNIKHAEMNCNEAESLILVTAYSTINIESCERLEVESKHCTYNIDNVRVFINSGKYDNFNIEFLDNVTMNTQFTDLNVEKLNDACNLTFNYGGASFNEVSDDFKTIVVNGQSADFEFVMDSDADFKLNAKSNHGDIDCFPGIQLMTSKGKGPAKELIGYFLNKASSSNIDVNINYGSFDLKRF